MQLSHLRGTSQRAQAHGKPHRRYDPCSSPWSSRPTTGPIEGIETPYGTLALVPPLWLTVDNGSTGYQRSFDRKWAEKIAANWHRAEARPTSCRLRDGQLWITNGQHTVNAAAIVGEERVLVIINNGSPSRQREAREFVDAQVKVKRMRPFDTYRASLVAGDKDALTVRKITNELEDHDRAEQGAGHADRDPGRAGHRTPRRRGSSARDAGGRPWSGPRTI